MDLDKKIQSKRHDELLGALKRVSLSISDLKGDDDSKLVASISKQTELIQSFLNEFKKAELREKQEDEEGGKEEKIVTSFESMANKILGELKSLREQLVAPKSEVKPEWTHTITKRDYYGRAEIIVSKPKN